MIEARLETSIQKIMRLAKSIVNTFSMAGIKFFHFDFIFGPAPFSKNYFTFDDFYIVD